MTTTGRRAETELADVFLLSTDGPYPQVRLICAKCGQPLYGDIPYNFSAFGGHSECTFGELGSTVFRVRVRISELTCEAL